MLVGYSVPIYSIIHYLFLLVSAKIQILYSFSLGNLLVTFKCCTFRIINKTKVTYMAVYTLQTMQI